MSEALGSLGGDGGFTCEACMSDVKNEKQGQSGVDVVREIPFLRAFCFSILR